MLRPTEPDASDILDEWVRFVPSGRILPKEEDTCEGDQCGQCVARVISWAGTDNGGESVFLVKWLRTCSKHTQWHQGGYNEIHGHDLTLIYP